MMMLLRGLKIDKCADDGAMTTTTAAENLMPGVTFLQGWGLLKVSWLRAANGLDLGKVHF